jgi:putative FmdB family regulatory protein
MPIYEYQCEGCGNQFEKLVRRSDDMSGLECPSCGEKHVSQQHYSTFSARANGAAPEPSGGCPAGMCRTPGMCGRN